MISLLVGTAALQFEGSSSRRGPAIPSTSLLPVIPAGSSSGVFFSPNTPSAVEPKPGDLICPRCGSRVLFGMHGATGDAYCIRSEWATRHPDHPLIADVSCNWTGIVTRTPAGGVAIVGVAP